jgi:hypothetical protein
MTRFIARFGTAHDYILQFIVTRTVLSTATSSLLLLSSGFQQRTFLFFWVPELSPASATSFSQQQFTTSEPQLFSQAKSKSKSKSCYDRRSVGKSILVWSPICGIRPDFRYCQTAAGLLMWGALSEGSVVYSCCRPRQRSHSRVRVARDSWPYFTVSHSRLSESGGPGPRICDLQVQGDPIISLGTEFPFRRLLQS